MQKKQITKKNRSDPVLFYQRGGKAGGWNAGRHNTGKTDDATGGSPGAAHQRQPGADTPVYHGLRHVLRPSEQGGDGAEGPPAHGGGVHHPGRGDVPGGGAIFAAHRRGAAAFPRLPEAVYRPEKNGLCPDGEHQRHPDRRGLGRLFRRS